MSHFMHQATLLAYTLDGLSTDGGHALAGGLLLLCGVAIAATMLLRAIHGLRLVHIQQGQRFSRCRLTGREAAGRLLGHVSLSAVEVEAGAQIDHYDLLRRRVKLRTESSVSSSVAALAIAAHEVGHAEQFARGYWAARATRCLLVLLVLGAAVLFVYPFAVTIAGTGDVNLTVLVVVLALVALLRLPVAIALERDATRRGTRLLDETGLAHESEQDGIARLLRAGFLVHVCFGALLVLLIGCGAGIMWLVENRLDAPVITSVQIAPASQPPGAQPMPAMPVVDVGDGFVYPLAVLVAIAAIWRAFFASSRKAPARSAADTNNEGMARFQAGDLAGALALIDEALRQDPALAAAHYNRAVVLTAQGRNPEALSSLEALFACRAEDAEPLLSIADPWFIRGTLRLDQSDYQGAIDDLSRALKLDPTEPATLFRNRGLAWIWLRNLDQALQDTDEALRLSPDDAVAYNNRGTIHRDLGNLEQAEADFRRAIAIDPELPNPREHLAKMLQCGAVV